MAETDRIGDYLQRLTPATRSNLLAELERLEICDVDIPGAATVLEKLRAEFCRNGQADNVGINARAISSSRWSRCWWMALPSIPITAGYRADRCRRSGNGSAGNCCGRWRPITSMP